MVRGGIDNVRMVKGDGVGSCSGSSLNSLAGVRIFFLDFGRGPATTGRARCTLPGLRPGGILHVATDHAEYAEWIDELVTVEDELEYIGWPNDPDERAQTVPVLTDRQIITKFEGKGLDKDHTIHEYLWRRR